MLGDRLLAGRGAVVVPAQVRVVLEADPHARRAERRRRERRERRAQARRAGGGTSAGSRIEPGTVLDVPAVKRREQTLGRAADRRLRRGALPVGRALATTCSRSREATGRGSRLLPTASADRDDAIARLLRAAREPRRRSRTSRSSGGRSRDCARTCSPRTSSSSPAGTPPRCSPSGARTASTRSCARRGSRASSSPGRAPARSAGSRTA